MKKVLKYISFAVLCLIIGGCINNDRNNKANKKNKNKEMMINNEYGIIATLSLESTNVYAGEMFSSKSKLINNGNENVLGSFVSWRYFVNVKQLYDQNAGWVFCENNKGVDDELAWIAICGTNGHLPFSAIHGSETPLVIPGQGIEQNDDVLIPMPGVYGIYVQWTVEISDRTKQKTQIAINSEECIIKVLPVKGMKYDSPIHKHSKMFIEKRTR